MNDVLTNITRELPAFWTLGVTIAAVAGLLLMISAAAGIAATRDTARYQGGVLGEWKNFWWKPIVGAMLLNLPGTLNAFAYTFFREDSRQMLSYSAPESPASAYITFVIAIVMLTGLYGVVSGLIGWGSSAQDPAKFMVSTSKIIGGSLAINVVTLLHIFGATAGGAVQNSIGLFFG